MYREREMSSFEAYKRYVFIYMFTNKNENIYYNIK